MKQQQRMYYLQHMGIMCWGERRTADVPETSTVDMKSDTAVEAADIEPSAATLTKHSNVQLLNELQQCVAVCQQCELHKTRTQTVFGVGSADAKLLIIGEAPGAQEDAAGEPFVGRAGQLLNAMLKAIGLDRNQAYIANILKCRPPNNRDPKPEEVAQCTPYLERQVNLLKPKVILATGRFAAHYLLQTNTAMGRLRGRKYQFRDTGIPLIVSYHPAYLLRSPREKAKAYQDLLLIKNCL